MPTNLRRGFNRLFIIIAVVWAIYCLVGYPMQKRAEAHNFYDKDLRNCYQYDLGKGEIFTECLKLAEKIQRISLDQWTPENFYIGQFWPLLVVVVGIPSGIYLLCRGLAALSLWIFRGFTSHA